jgi:hypothetical protein
LRGSIYKVLRHWSGWEGKQQAKQNNKQKFNLIIIHNKVSKNAKTFFVIIKTIFFTKYDFFKLVAKCGFIFLNHSII